MPGTPPPVAPSLVWIKYGLTSSFRKSNSQDKCSAFGTTLPRALSLFAVITVTHSTESGMTKSWPREHQDHRQSQPDGPAKEEPWCPASEGSGSP